MLGLRPAMDDLIVVAAYGLQTPWVQQCMASLREHAPDVNVLTVDTSSGGHPTGAYLSAYRETGADRFLFIQDSMTALADPLPHFREQWTGAGAVGWGLFRMAWDTAQQRQWVHDQYGAHDPPACGIFGPVFYTDRASLDKVAAADLLPLVPGNRLQAQGSERAWAYAFHRAGMPVAGPMWNHSAMSSPQGFGPFRKVWAGRP